MYLSHEPTSKRLFADNAGFACWEYNSLAEIFLLHPLSTKLLYAHLGQFLRPQPLRSSFEYSVNYKFEAQYRKSTNSPIFDEQYRVKDPCKGVAGLSRFSVDRIISHHV